MDDDLFPSLNSSFNTQHDSESSMSTGPSSSSYYFTSGAPPSFPTRHNTSTGVAQMKLADLFVNQHVEELFNKWTEATRATTRYIEEQHRLLLQVSALQNTVFTLRTELADVQRKLESAIANQVSVNNAGPSVAVTQPSDIGTRPPARIGRIVRPDNLPHSVLWSIEDTRQYEGLTTRSNKSRPKMELCIRKPNGEIISTPEYNGLQKLVRRVVADKLLTLPIPKDPAAASGQRTRRWYQRWYLPIYRDAITELEGAEPLLALCGGSWKADQLVGHHLYWQATRDHATNESANIGQKRGLEDTRDFEEEWGDRDIGEATRRKADNPVAKKRKKTATTMGKSKDKENAPPSRPGPISAAATSSTSSLSPPLSIETQLSTLGQVALPSHPLPAPPNGDLTRTCNEPAATSTAALSQDQDKTQMLPPSDLPPTENVGHGNSAAALSQDRESETPIPPPSDLPPPEDVGRANSTAAPSSQSHDRETSIPPPSDLPPTENLRHTNGDVSKSSNRLDIDFIQIDKALSSLRRELSTDFPNMTTIANLFDAMEANPHFTDKPPSTTVVHFIDTLEAADPNSPDLSEDETDAQWGHKQLSGIWKGVLTSWDAIGCCDVATRLLAALLRTCRVARYVCSERRIQVGSYLADMYLDQIIDHIWDLWKTAGGPISKGKGKETTTTATASKPPAESSTILPPATSNALASGAQLDSAAAASSNVSSTLNDIDHQNEVGKALRKLTKDQLKDILEAHKIKSTSRKSQPTKPELVADILAAPISSGDAIFAEVQTALLNKRADRGRNKGLEGL